LPERAILLAAWTTTRLRRELADALRTFPADELIVVTLPDEDAAWLEKGSAETALNRFSSSHTPVVERNDLAKRS
jgi:hypothetical protein